MSTPLFFSSGNLLADRRFHFGTELAARGDLAAAADLFVQAVELAPGFVSAWFALGETRERMGDRTQAAEAFRQARQLDPQDRHGAALHLARLGERVSGEAMPARHVETLFDQYAPRFDTALTERLAYRAPALLRAAVEKVCAEAAIALRFGEALDLGCGTGLAGLAFRDVAARLTGVDLSAGMLAIARAKNLYDELLQSEIMAYLAHASAKAEHGGEPGAPARRFDLLLAADVFAYFSDLAPVAAAVARVLAAGGLFAFTVETHAGAGVVLGEKLRYAHGAAHVRAALAAAGLAVLELSEAATRTEAGRPVPGLVIVARTPA